MSNLTASFFIFLGILFIYVPIMMTPSDEIGVILKIMYSLLCGIAIAIFAWKLMEMNPDKRTSYCIIYVIVTFVLFIASTLLLCGPREDDD